MTVADLATGKLLRPRAKSRASVGDRCSGAPARLDRCRATRRAPRRESYFDYDALITLGALALAGGALSAFGRRRGRRKSAEKGAAAGAAQLARSVFARDPGRSRAVHRRLPPRRLNGEFQQPSFTGTATKFAAALEPEAGTTLLHGT